MKVYIGTALARAEDHNALRDALATRGWEVTYDWTVHGNVKGEGPGRLRDISGKEVQGIRDADVVVILLPGGRGTHVELGVALGANKPLVLVGAQDYLAPDARTCAFYHHPAVHFITVLETTFTPERAKWIAQVLSVTFASVSSITLLANERYAETSGAP